jgi:hypothetical protein
VVKIREKEQSADSCFSRDVDGMITTYKEFQINVETIAGGTTARARVLRGGFVVPNTLIDDVLWMYASDVKGAIDIARFFIDGMEKLALSLKQDFSKKHIPYRKSYGNGASAAAGRQIQSKPNLFQPYREAVQ